MKTKQIVKQIKTSDIIKNKNHTRGEKNEIRKIYKFTAFEYELHYSDVSGCYQGSSCCEEFVNLRKLNEGRVKPKGRKTLHLNCDTPKNTGGKRK